MVGGKYNRQDEALMRQKVGVFINQCPTPTWFRENCYRVNGYLSRGNESLNAFLDRFRIQELELPQEIILQGGFGCWFDG